MMRNLDDRMLLLLALAPLILAIVVFAAILGVRTLTMPPPTLTPTITPLPVIVITATFVPPTSMPLPQTASPTNAPRSPSTAPSATPRGSIEIRYRERSSNTGQILL
jgi:hypothetical protein